MRFQEELISKIMTYFTVILLLGILVFEAWSLQRERTSRREAQESAASAQDMLDEMTSQNARLEEENEALHERLEEWEPYLSLAESEEMVSLKRELFSHPALIPDQAVEALTEELAQERAEEQESPAEESQTAAEEEETESELVFEFHKDGGEPVFFPLSTQVVDADNCLIYTVAYEKTSGRKLGLLYEVDLDWIREESSAQKSFEEEAENEPFREGNAGEESEEEAAGPEIPGGWICVAYNTGSGWNGVEENGD